MKRIILFFAVIFSMMISLSAQDWKSGDSNDSYYGPGMMWGNGGDYGPGMMWGGNGYGPGMMGGYWMDNGWHDYGKSSLNLNKGQQQQWSNVANNGRQNQKAVNDSINYYVKEIQRLQKAKSSMVQTDLNEIKKVLTPQQYTQFLEKLVSGNPY